MAKFSIKWAESKRKGETNGRAWEITEMTLVDEQGIETEGVSTFDKVVNGGTLEGTIEKNDKGYLNFVPVKTDNRKPNMERVMEKKASMIGEAQDKKAQNVSEAQGRNEVMWAKYNASELVAHHPAFKDLSKEEVLKMVEELASKIANAKLEPF